MIHHRKKDEVRRFDTFKLIVLVGLIALLLWFWLAPPAFVQDPDEVSENTAAAIATGDTFYEENDRASLDNDEPTPNIAALEIASPVFMDGQEGDTAELLAGGHWSFDLDLGADSFCFDFRRSNANLL